MLTSIATHLQSTRISAAADWAVLVIGAVMLTTAIVGTLVTPGVAMQDHVHTEEARTKAAL